MNLTFQRETELTPDEFVDVLHRSTLAERRPVDEPETIRAMLEHADLIVTELLAPQPGERTLDLGCGTGQRTAQAALIYLANGDFR